MVDALKDGMTAWLERVRSPIAGSIVLAFVAVNWQPIWFVIWSDVEGTERFLYFDENTNWQSLYLWPVIFGSLLGILGPWLRWFGAIFALIPTKKYREIEDKQASERRIDAIERNILEQKKRTELQKASELAEIAKGSAEAAADRRRIARSERAERAVNLGDGVAAEIIRESLEAEKNDSINSRITEYISNISPIKAEIVKLLGKANEAIFWTKTRLVATDFWKT